MDSNPQRLGYCQLKRQNIYRRRRAGYAPFPLRASLIPRCRRQMDCGLDYFPRTRRKKFFNRNNAPVLFRNTLHFKPLCHPQSSRFAFFRNRVHSVLFCTMFSFIIQRVARYFLPHITLRIFFDKRAFQKNRTCHTLHQHQLHLSDYAFASCRNCRYNPAASLHPFQKTHKSYCF